MSVSGTSEHELRRAGEGELRRMLTYEQIYELTGFSKRVVRHMEKRGEFPLSVWIGPRRRAWYADEVIAWQQGLPRGNWGDEEAKPDK